MHRTIPSTVLIAVLAVSVAAPSAQRVVDTVAPGIAYSVLTRGEPAATQSYRVLLGSFEHQSEADQMLERLLGIGCAALPTSDGSIYRIVSPALPHRAEAEELKRHLIDLGVSEPLEIEEVRQDLTNPRGPWTIHVLEVDPRMVEVRVAHAYDTVIGLETTAELAGRLGATAAVNGGYFHMEGLLAGDPQGVLQIAGHLVSEPDRGRAAVGFSDRDGFARAVFGRLGFHGEIRFTDGLRVTVDGLNRDRGPSEIVLYTPEFHRTTLTPPGGVEIIVDGGRVREIRNGGSSVIPGQGMVLSLGGERVCEAVPRVSVGDGATFAGDLLPLLPDPEGEWRSAEDIVGGGPLLLLRGQRFERPEDESLSRAFYFARHPRTAVGVRADGTLLFVAVDGRRPESSVGMSIPELTDLMLELGAVSAVNLDGGGSTTMVIENRVVNHPSGASARKNADAILVFPKNR